MKALKWLSGICGAVGIVVLLLTFAVQIPTFSMWFYEYEFQKNGTYEQVQMEKEDLLGVTRHMLEYMQGDEDILNIETVVNGEQRLFFSEIEIFHMNDVKNLFSIGFTVQTIMVLLFTLAAVLFISPVLGAELGFFLKCIRTAGICVISVMIVIAVLIIFDFDNAFTVFHEIFFDNDMWLLDPDIDLLVNIVPTPFFTDIATFIGIVYGVFLSAAIGLSVAGLKYNRKVKGFIHS